MILITTSRRPTRVIRTFCKDLSHTIPHTLRLNRGKLSLQGLEEKAVEFDAEKIVIIDRWKGGPGKIQLFMISKEGLQHFPPLVYIRGVKLQRDFARVMPKSRRIKSMAITVSDSESFETEKLGNALSKFFEVPITPFEQVAKGYDAIMHIAREWQGFLTVTFKLCPEMVEIGPYMIVSHLLWEVKP